ALRQDERGAWLREAGPFVEALPHRGPAAHHPEPRLRGDEYARRSLRAPERRGRGDVAGRGAREGSMKIRLDYGREGLEVEVPERNLAGVLELRSAPPLPDPGAAIRGALEQPVGAPPLAELCRDKRSACVVISDITRPVPNAVLLPP